MSDESLKELIARSSMAFVGTVRSLGQSPEPGIEADEHTALVQLEQAVHAPDQVDLSPGSAVVVQLDADLPMLSPGQRATFFVEPLIYGETLVVQEVARREEAQTRGLRRGAAEDAADAMTEAVDELAAESELEHARSADAVVRGHVVALRAAASSPQHEHDPQWWIATLDVDLVARGEVPGVGDEGGEVDVRYANSIDQRWRAWPKPKAGQSGMWILHRAEGEDAGAAFQLMHQDDLQPSLLLDDLIGEAPDDDEAGDDEP
jgi:hypothetical protein